MAYFTSYNNNTVYDSTTRERFDEELSLFLNKHSKTPAAVSNSFSNIHSYILAQKAAFREETYIRTCMKIMHTLAALRNSESLVDAEAFLRVVKSSEYEKFLPNLQKHSNKNTPLFVAMALYSDNIKLASDVTKIFIHPEQRKIEALGESFISWCLKNTKLAALKFLLSNYSGFNDKNMQLLFIEHAYMGDEYLSKVFPDNKYPKDLCSTFDGLLNHSSSSFSVSTSRKIDLACYFSKNTNLVPREFALFISASVSKNEISQNLLTENGLIPKLISKETLSSIASLEKNECIAILYKYLLPIIDRNLIPSTLFDFLSSQPSKNISDYAFMDFIKLFPDFSKDKSDEIQKMIMGKSFIDLTLVDFLNEKMTFSAEFKKYISESKNPLVYFSLNSPVTDPDYIDRSIDYLSENMRLPDFPRKSFIYRNEVINRLFEVKTNDEIIKKFLMAEGYSDEVLRGAISLNKTLVFDWAKATEQEKMNFFTNVSWAIDPDVIQRLSSGINKKWYQIKRAEPLQLILENSEFRLAYKAEDTITIAKKNDDETIDKSSLSVVLAQAKIDLNEFNKITSEQLDFNLEFKIRSESIFMQQMEFLTQIKKIENDLRFEDLFFLKNNLGKYLLQCTDTYSRALKRHQTLLENPGLFKRQDSTLEAQKERIDSEALKQVTLLEKELNFVKENVIKTINSDSFTDMKINTRFLEATSEYKDNVGTVVKLVVNKKQ